MRKNDKQIECHWELECSDKNVFSDMITSRKGLQYLQWEFYIQHMKEKKKKIDHKLMMIHVYFICITFPPPKWLTEKKNNNKKQKTNLISRLSISSPWGFIVTDIVHTMGRCKCVEEKAGSDSVLSIKEWLLKELVCKIWREAIA